MSNLVLFGYDCYWDCIPALSVGAPHLRDRVWIVAAPMGTLDLPEPKCTKKNPGGHIANIEKLPRAGAASGWSLYECEPRATIKMCKEAVGAVKENGVTWLTNIDQSLWPTPHGMQAPNPRFAGPSGNELGRAVNQAARLWKTPQSSSGGQRPVEGTSPTGQTPDGRKVQVGLAHEVAAEQRLWPTSNARDWKDSGPNVDWEKVAARSNLAGAVNVEPTRKPNPFLTGIKIDNPDPIALLPTPQSSQRGDRGRGSVEGGGGETLHHAALNRLWPTATSSPQENIGTRGKHLSGEVGEEEITKDRKPGPLSPDWCEWLCGIPIGWTDLECADPIQLDWLSEYGIPRVKHSVQMRRQRLQAIGNCLICQVAHHIIGEALSRLR